MNARTTPNARSFGGDEFRAKLRDLDWVRAAGPVELRHAVHALCWRLNRTTVDGFCDDPQVADKILIAASGIKDELDARIAEAEQRESTAGSGELNQQTRNDLASLRRRKTSVDTVISACRTAVALGQQRPPAAEQLAQAISAHRNEVRDLGERDADTKLWGVLDRVTTRARPAQFIDCVEQRV